MAAEQEHPTATLGGGCFWCLEAVYKDLKGVRAWSRATPAAVAEPELRAGLRRRDRPCGGGPDHLRSRRSSRSRPAGRVLHDPRPDDQDRQGADVGPQYRSIILYHNAEQKAAAERRSPTQREGHLARADRDRGRAAREFYPAEAYHQDYFELNPLQPYCKIVIAPKVAKFRKEHLARLQR